jgi:hypothetical protein
MKKLLYLFLVLPLIFSSCKKEQGCTEISALNYNIDADTDDGTCIYEGCTDATANNYSDVASIDDGSCCKDCTLAYEIINGFDPAELDAIANSYGYADFGTFYIEEMLDGGDEWESGEFCAEDLTDAEDEEELEDVDENGTMDFRVYWDCQ